MRTNVRTASVIAAAAFALAACGVEGDGLDDPLEGDLGGTDDPVLEDDSMTDDGGGMY